MPRYAFAVEYEGSRFKGWQRQPDARTVQQELERALSLILQQNIQVVGSGRTDTGVHAEAQVAHFDVHQELQTADLLDRLNKVVDPDIHVHLLQSVSEDFHARFSATFRQYRYQLMLRYRPLKRRHCFHVYRSVDWSIVEDCLKRMEGSHDFAWFSKKASELPHAVCRMHYAGLECVGADEMHVRLQANRFLRHMVRGIVGAVLMAGAGMLHRDTVVAMLGEGPARQQSDPEQPLQQQQSQEQPDQKRAALESERQAREQQGASGSFTRPKTYVAPAHALVLEKAGYPELDL